MLCGALVVVVTVRVAMVVAMVMMVAAAAMTQEVTLLGWGDVMMICDAA